LANTSGTKDVIQPKPAVAESGTHEPNGIRLAAVSRRWAPRAWRREVVVVLGASLASRIAVIFTAQIATWYAKPLTAKPLTVSQALNAWDGGWYLSIAHDGYPGTLLDQGFGNAWVFFPGLPILVKLGHFTGLSYETSAAIVSFLAAGFAALGVYLAVRAVLGERVGVSTAVLLVFLPNSYVLSMTYSEGLFVACAAFCLYFLVIRRWEAAGLAALLGGFTRISGLVLIACCAFEALRVATRERTVRPLTAPALAPLGLVIFMIYGKIRVDDFLAYKTAEQQGFHNYFEWFRPVWRALGVVTSTAGWQYATAVMPTLALICVVIGSVALVRTSRIPSVWWVYSVLTVVLALTPPSWTLTPRYMLPAFPLYAAVMGKLPECARSILISTSAVVMGALALGAFLSVLNFRAAPMVP
jgi:Gpi18-like mannosyltransferase